MTAHYGEPFISDDGQTVHAELWYPRTPERPQKIVVSLIDIRAADDLTIRYDFDRDGWVICQDEVAMEPMLHTVRENVEVAFISAWNTKEDPS